MDVTNADPRSSEYQIPPPSVTKSFAETTWMPPSAPTDSAPRAGEEFVDRRVTTQGDEVETHDVWLRHPGHAKVVSSRGQTNERDYDVWAAGGDG